MTPERRKRQAARVIVVDEAERVLLFRGGDPHRPEGGTWWFTPGGGLEAGETYEAAGRRELFEETGLACGDLGPVIFRSETEFEFAGVIYEQSHEFFRISTANFTVDASGWEPLESASIVESRWWTAAELTATTETVYPENLVDLLADR